MASWDAREEENLDKKTAADYLKSQATSQARAMLLENLKSNGPGLIGDAGNALTWGDPAPAVAVAPKASADAQAAAPAALAERRRIAELEKKLAVEVLENHPEEDPKSKWGALAALMSVRSVRLELRKRIARNDGS